MSHTYLYPLYSWNTDVTNVSNFSLLNSKITLPSRIFHSNVGEDYLVAFHSLNSSQAHGTSIADESLGSEQEQQRKMMHTRPTRELI